MKWKKKLLSEIKISYKKFHKSDMSKLIRKRFQHKSQILIASEIIKRSNILSPIFLEKSNRCETIINFHSGFSFNIPISASLLPSSGKWNEINVNCLVIDGMIESISEIHHLLEKAAENSTPHVLFVRSMSEDVKNTIMLNLKRGTINLIPIEVGFDENTLNILNDISVCCNARLVSSLTGDLISTAVKNDICVVDKISITKMGVVISNNVNDDVLKNQIKYLMEKRENSESIELSEMYDKRIRSLSSGMIVLKIGKDMISKDPGTIEKFDRFFREVRSFVKHGVFKRVGSPDILKYITKNPEPYLSLYVAIRHAFSFISAISSIDKVILENRI